MHVNRCWTTEHDDGFCSLSIETLLNDKEPWNKLHCEVSKFPIDPTPENPLRQVIILSLLDENDLYKLKTTIDKRLGLIH